MLAADHVVEAALQPQDHADQTRDRNKNHQSNLGLGFHRSAISPLARRYFHVAYSRSIMEGVRESLSWLAKSCSAIASAVSAPAVSSPRLTGSPPSRQVKGPPDSTKVIRPTFGTVRPS